jgi:hypothetical protein
MFDYLYYKLYQAALKSSLYDIPEFMAPVSFGCLISANVLVISGFLSNVSGIPFLFSTTQQASLFALLMMFLTTLYFRKDKRKSILKKYSMESNEDRVRGNTLIAIYVGVSFLLIFVVAYLKPNR